MVCLNIEDVVGRYQSSEGEDFFIDYTKEIVECEEIYNISRKY